jgi:hypothetical protein
MAYLINVGTGGRIRETKSGHGSRGFHIYRRGMKVYCEWAGINVVSRKYYWRGKTQVIVYPFRSVARAESFRLQRLRELQQPFEGYLRLPFGITIHRKRVER